MVFIDWIDDVHTARLDKGFLLVDLHPMLSMHVDIVGLAECEEPDRIKDYIRQIAEELDILIVDGALRQESLYSAWNGTVTPTWKYPYAGKPDVVSARQARHGCREKGS